MLYYLKKSNSVRNYLQRSLLCSCLENKNRIRELVGQQFEVVLEELGERDDGFDEANPEEFIVDLSDEEL